jgi:hypothetical protein
LSSWRSTMTRRTLIDCPWVLSSGMQHACCGRGVENQPRCLTPANGGGLWTSARLLSLLNTVCILDRHSRLPCLQCCFT